MSRFVWWDRRTRELRSRDFHGRCAIVGYVLVAIDERKFWPIWADDREVAAIDFPDDLPECEFLEGDHHRGYMVTLVKQMSDGQFGLVRANRGSEVNWFSKNVIHADGLKVNGNGRPYLRLSLADGTTCMFNGMARVLRVYAGGKMSPIAIGDSRGVCVSGGDHASFVNVHDPSGTKFVRSDKDFAFSLRVPTAFPYVSIVRATSQGEKHAVVYVDPTPERISIVSEDFDEIVHLANLEGKAYIIGRIGDRWTIQLGQYLSFCVSTRAVDWRRCMLIRLGDSPGIWKVFAPIMQGGRWQVTDGELNFGPTLTEVYSICVYRGRLRILGRDGHMVRTYDVQMG